MNPTTPVDRNMFKGTVTHFVPGFPPISLHCVENVRIRSYSGPYFPAFGLNTERYGVSLRIQSKCVKTQTSSAAFYHIIEIAVEYPIKLHWI